MDGNTIGVLISKVVIALIIMQMLLGLISYLILLERKTAAWIQDRVGPNRTGPKGLLQPIADGVKFILKEEFIPQNADKFLFILAPIAILTPAMVGFAVIPWGGIWGRVVGAGAVEFSVGFSVYGVERIRRRAGGRGDGGVGNLWGGAGRMGVGFEVFVSSAGFGRRRRCCHMRCRWRCR